MKCVVCGGDCADEACYLFTLPIYASLPPKEFRKRVQASSDLCAVDAEHFYILGNLDIPVRNTDRNIRYTLWSSLSKANFMRAIELWDQAGREAEPPYFGWLSNKIPGYDDPWSIKLKVRTQPVGFRPLIEVIEEGHPLWRDQREGISLERYYELCHLARLAFPSKATRQ